MTESEALTLRKNGAKLYNHTRVAFYTALEYFRRQIYTHDDIDKNAIRECVDLAWDATNLDDTFHDLNSQGYRQLIRDGWNPYVANDPNTWQPSPDCVDNPTTRGGVAI